MAKNGYTISLTKNLILKEIWLNPGISRTDLAASMDLNKSTITKAIADLEEIGLISTTEIGVSGPKGGRRRLKLDISGSYGSILGVELRTDAVILAAVSLRGEVIHREEMIMEWNSASLKDMLEGIFSGIPGIEKKVGVPILGIGIGLPGTIDPEKGIVYFSDPLEIDEALDVAALCRELTDLPVLIENDGNCCAWGELVFRKEKCPDHFLYVLGEFRPHGVTRSKLRIPAIGLALVIDRKLQYGQSHCKGEFQSIFHNPGYLNSFSLSDEEVRRIEQDPDSMKRIINELARNIALLINVLNLDAVIVGGNFEEHEDLIRNEFLKAIHENWPAKQIFKRQILFSHLKELTVAYGAAGMFVEKLFSIPDFSNPFFKSLNLLDR